MAKVSRELSAWRVMNRRCEDPKHKDFKRYGAKGITVCPAWKENFPAFLADMGMPPTQAHWLGRLNVLGNYEPGNCVWTTQPEQERRRAYCRKVTIFGKELTAAEAGRLPGQPSRNSVLRRQAHGLPLDVPAPKLYRKSVWLTHDGVTLPLPEMARRHGIQRILLWERLKAGWPIERALNLERSKGRSPSLTPTLDP